MRAPFSGVADVVEYLGNEELLHVSVGAQEIVAIVDSSYRVRPGDVVDLKLPVEKLHLFNIETGDALSPGRRPDARQRDPSATAGPPRRAGRST